MSWSADTDLVVVLLAKPQLVKNDYLTQQLHHDSEKVMIS